MYRAQKYDNETGPKLVYVLIIFALKHLSPPIHCPVVQNVTILKKYKTNLTISYLKSRTKIKSKQNGQEKYLVFFLQ